MTDPLPLALLVAGALAFIATAVTLILWRTVHGHHSAEERRDSRIARLYEGVLAGEPMRYGKDVPVDVDALRQRFDDVRRAGDTTLALGIAAGLDVLGEGTPPLREFLAEAVDPVDSHRWNRIGDTTLTQLVFSPRQDPTLDALFALLSPAMRRNLSLSPEDLGLNEFQRCTQAEEGPEVLLTLHRCSHALGLDFPRIYVDESKNLDIVVRHTAVAGHPRHSLLIGRTAAMLPTTAQRAFLCGSRLASLHPALSIITQIDSAKTLHRLIREGAAAAAGAARRDMQFGFLSKAIHGKEAGRMLATMLQKRGGQPSLKEVERWYTAATESCWRVGLLLAGDLREAKSVLTILNEPADTTRRALENLVGFRLSTTYVEARKALIDSD